MLNVKDVVAKKGQTLFANFVKIFAVLNWQNLKLNNMRFIACSIKSHERQVNRIKTNAALTCRKSGRLAGKAPSCVQIKTFFCWRSNVTTDVQNNNKNICVTCYLNVFGHEEYFKCSRIVSKMNLTQFFT